MTNEAKRTKVDLNQAVGLLMDAFEADECSLSHVNGEIYILCYKRENKQSAADAVDLWADDEEISLTRREAETIKKEILFIR